MTRTYLPDNSRSFKERWLIAPKLLFFCIGVITFCMGDSISRIGGDNWGLSTYQTFSSVYEFAASVVGSLVFSNRADKRNNFRTILAVCVIGLFFTVMEFGPNQMPSYQGPLPMLYRVFICFIQFFSAGLYPVTSALVLKILSSNSKTSYGCQRMYVPLGHLFVVLLFCAFQHFLQQQPLDFIVHLGILFLFSVVFLGVLFIFDTKVKSFEITGQEAGNAESVEKSNSLYDESSFYTENFEQLASIDKNESISVSPFKKLFADPKFLILFIGFLIAGINSSYLKISWIYQIRILAGTDFERYMENEATYISCVSEALIYCFDEKITQILGNNLMMALGHGLLILRTLSFAFMNPEDVNTKTFIFNSVSGIPNGLISLSAVHTASELASGATAQSIFDIPIRGLAILFAIIIFEISWRFQVVSIRTAYISMSILGAIIIIPIVFLDKIFPRKLNKKTSPFNQ